MHTHMHAHTHTHTHTHTHKQTHNIQCMLPCLTVIQTVLEACRPSVSTTVTLNLYTPGTSFDAVATGRSAFSIMIEFGPLKIK